MTRALVAWCAFAIGVIDITVDIMMPPLTPTGLFLLGVVFLLLWAWLIGVFRRSFWVTPIPETHPDALGSLDIAERLPQSEPNQ